MSKQLLGISDSGGSLGSSGSDNSSEVDDSICFGELAALQESLTMMKPGKLRTIRLQRRPGSSYFGFAVRGGREYGENGLGFFITKVIPGSESELQGLEVGDQVVRIDGMPVREALHKEMLNFIRSKTHVTLSVRGGNVLPFYECTNQAVTWQQIRTSRVHHPTLTASSSWSSDASSHHRVNHDHHHHEPQQQPSFASLTLRADSKGRLGCSLCEGPSYKRGIYFQSTDEGSVARAAGIKAGDRIISCNGTDMRTIDFEEAVDLMKETSVLNLVISRGAGSDFISAADESSGYNSATSSINGDQSPMQNGQLKRLSIVREEIIDVIDERRGLIVGSVTMDCRKSSSSWSDVGNEPSRQRHHQQHRVTPAPLLKDEEAINKDTAKVLQHGARIGMLQQQHGEQQQQQQQTDDERRLLHEERRRIEEAQRQLSLEKEKLARERQQLEVARQRMINGSSSVAPSMSSSSHTASTHHHHHHKVNSEEKKRVKEVNDSTTVSRAISNPVQQQHVQLMEEFKQKMCSLKSSESDGGSSGGSGGISRSETRQQAKESTISSPVGAALTGINKNRAPPTLLKSFSSSVSATQPPPPPPPPLPCGSQVILRTKKQAAPPPPPPSRVTALLLPPPDYYDDSDPVAMSSSYQKSPPPSPPVTDGGTNKGTQATGASSARLSLDEIDGGLLRNKQRPPPAAAAAADASSSSSSSSSSQRRATTSGASGVRVSIGTFQSQVLEQRPEPTKLDFLPSAATKSSNNKSRNGSTGRHSVGGAIPRLTADGQVVQVKSLLQTELNETLSRARLRQRQPSVDDRPTLLVPAATFDDDDNNLPPKSTAPSPSERQMQSSITQPLPPPPPLLSSSSAGRKSVTSSNGPAASAVAASSQALLTVADKKNSVILELKSRNTEVDSCVNQVESNSHSSTSEKTMTTATPVISNSSSSSDKHASTIVIAGSGPSNQVVAKDVQHNASKPLVTSPVVKQVEQQQQQQEQGTLGRRQHQRRPSMDIQNKIASLVAAAAGGSTTTLPAATAAAAAAGSFSTTNSISSSSSSTSSSSSSSSSSGGGGLTISLRNANSSNSSPSNAAAATTAYRNNRETISQSSDNKVTIIVNAYVSPTNSEAADAAATAAAAAAANNQTQSTSSHHHKVSSSSPTLGQTMYIDDVPITEL